jgi:tetratricopeptide (TPR) repeat protein
MSHCYKIRHFLLAVLTILTCLPASEIFGAAVTDSLLARGNEYYMQRQYDMAEKYYSRILQLGYESYDLYYNLGNTLYKQDKVAAAILYYEKALQLKPGDDDTKHNLTLANAKIVDKIDVIPEFFMIRWVKALRGLFSPDQWAVISLVLFIGGLSGFTLFYFGHHTGLRRTGLNVGISLVFLTILSFLFMFGRIKSIKEHSSGIIMAPSVNARSSPDEQSTNVFVLHEGTKVMIRDSVQNWKEIKIANGNTGWIPAEAMEEI